MVVLPELSSPIMIILIYFLLQSLLNTLPKKLPMVNLCVLICRSD